MHMQHMDKFYWMVDDWWSNSIWKNQLHEDGPLQTIYCPSQLNFQYKTSNDRQNSLHTFPGGAFGSAK